MFNMPQLPDFDEMTANFDAMREDIQALRGLMERLVEIEETKLDLAPGRRVGAETVFNWGGEPVRSVEKKRTQQ